MGGGVGLDPGEKGEAQSPIPEFSTKTFLNPSDNSEKNMLRCTHLARRMGIERTKGLQTVIQPLDRMCLLTVPSRVV